MKKTIVTVVIELEGNYVEDDVYNIIDNTLNHKETLQSDETYTIVDIDHIEE